MTGNPELGREAARDLVRATISFTLALADRRDPADQTAARTYLDALAFLTCELSQADVMVMVQSLATQLVKCVDADSIDEARDCFERWLG